jgi:hypothetical protein
MADVFISYAREDRGLVDELYEHIDKSGYTAWYDPDLLVGAQWRRVVPTEIRKCRALIVLWSENSARSDVVPLEVDEAARLDKPIIALRVRDFDLERIPFGFGHLQTTLSTAYPQILEALRSYVPVPDEAAKTPAGDITPASIFASAMPLETLVSRTETKEALTLLAAISGVGRCVRVCGPTKSGKTVLINEALRGRDPIYVSGRRVDDIKSFYEEIAVRIDPSHSSTATEAFVFARAAQAKRPIVIDDYHRIPFRTRKAIVNRLQSFLDENISVILVSWTDIDSDLIADDPGLDGRAPPPISISFWKNVDLEKIGQQGFKALNLKPSAFTLSLITRHSYNNPFLMHEHCRYFAEACGIVSRPNAETSISVTAEKAAIVFNSLCATTRRNFLPLLEGRGADRFNLISGGSTTAFGLIALGVRRMQPIHAIGMQKLADNVRDLVAEPARINRHTTKECVDDLMSVLEKSPHKHTAIELSGNKLHIHPFFKRYLLWDFAPSKGMGYPDMTGYHDEDVQF